MEQYGGFWRRFAASFIDGIILLIPTELINFILFMMIVGGDVSSFIAYETGQDLSMYWGFEAIALTLTTIVNVIYFAKLHSSSWQATLGKRMLGMKVTTVEGERISFGRAVGRYFAMILSAIPLMIGFMLAGWTKKKRALHDFVAGTVVIRTR
ncbi:RDD family protein [Bacillus tianshenii]|nr:RDD family protein [Bacillus tianshenii]